MAYDRYDTRDAPRDERSRWSDDRNSDRWRAERGGERSGRDDRGFFERAGDEVASWFGDDEAERRRREDRMRDEREGRAGGRDHQDRDRDWNQNRGTFASGGSSERDYDPNWGRQSFSNSDRGRFREGGRDYRPMTGDYGRGEPRADNYDRSQSPWGRDEYRTTSRAGTADRSDRSRHEELDPHYRSWRDRQMSELDRDYDDYRREHQSKFESDFGSWRERRQQKRGMLGQVRGQMEVVGNDEQHVGMVDRVAGDRIILAKSDPDSGGAHHSLSCSEVDRVDGDRVILGCSADQARMHWRDESRSRALFERDDQGEMGPRMLDRSFEGTYR
jgi:hypothetical protein